MKISLVHHGCIEEAIFPVYFSFLKGNNMLKVGVEECIKHRIMLKVEIGVSSEFLDKPKLNNACCCTSDCENQIIWTSLNNPPEHTCLGPADG